MTAALTNACTTTPRINQPGADAVTACISRETSPEQFEEVRKKQPHYLLSYRDRIQETALSVSFGCSNILLAIHIIKQGGEVIANQKDKDGKPPLFWAITEYLHRDNILLFQKALLEAGADVNLRWKLRDRSEPRSATLLWQVLEDCNYNTINAEYLCLAIMLLKQDAEIYPALTQRGKNFLIHAERVHNIMKVKQKQISDLKEGLKSSTSCYFSVLPPDLTVMAVNVLHPSYQPMEAFDQDEELLIQFAHLVLLTEKTLHTNASDLISPKYFDALKKLIVALDKKYETIKSHHNPRYPEIFAPDAELIGQIGPELMMTLNGFREVVDQLEKAVLAEPVKKELTVGDVLRERLIDTTWQVLAFGILSFAIYMVWKHIADPLQKKAR